MESAGIKNCRLVFNAMAKGSVQRLWNRIEKIDRLAIPIASRLGQDNRMVRITAPHHPLPFQGGNCQASRLATVASGDEKLFDCGSLQPTTGVERSYFQRNAMGL